MYVCYILLSVKYAKSYVGVTNNVPRRLKEHNAGYNTYSKRYKPWSIIHLESCTTREEAYKREKYYKTASGRRWLKNNAFNKAGVAKLVDLPAQAGAHAQ